jgi:hypothetical protein
VNFIHKENSTRCNNVSKFLFFHIYMKLNMFVVGHNVPDDIHQLHIQQPSTYEKPEAANAVLGS